MMMCSTSTRSSLELMLDSLRQKDEQLPDVPPALPIRPVSKARLPPARRGLPVKFQNCEFREDTMGNEDSKREPISNRNRVGFVPNKIKLSSVMDSKREGSLEGIRKIQKYFRGHQARCYYLKLKGGVIILQSFVRGENSRKNYQLLTRRLAAVIVIQQHTKHWIEWRTMQKRQSAVICLQSVIRSWLTRKCANYKANLRLLAVEPMKDMRKQDCVNYKANLRLLGIEPMKDMKKLDRRNLETKESQDYVQVLPSAIADLQRRLLKAETELGQKEKENGAMRQQLQQLDNKWAHYEAKMRSMEKNWQEQLTSLQMSLATAKKSLISECTTDQPVTLDPFPLYHSHGGDDSMSMETQATDGVHLSDTKPQQTNRRLNGIYHQLSEQRKEGFHGDSVGGGELKSGQLSSNISHDEERRKLKLKFETWTKDYKTRLQETTATLQKLGHSEAKKSRKKWWGR